MSDNETEKKPNFDPVKLEQVDARLRQYCRDPGFFRIYEKPGYRYKRWQPLYYAAGLFDGNGSWTGRIKNKTDRVGTLFYSLQGIFPTSDATNLNPGSHWAVKDTA